LSAEEKTIVSVLKGAKNYPGSACLIDNGFHLELI